MSFKCPKCSHVVCLICNYFRSVRYLLLILRKYVLKVHVLVSFEPKLYAIINASGICLSTVRYIHIRFSSSTLPLCIEVAGFGWLNELGSWIT